MSDDIAVRHLRLPLSESDARSLDLGDRVTLTGTVFTGRSRFHIRAIEKGILPPLDYARINAFFHVGPVMAEVGGRWTVVSIEPTSSIRFERYGPAVIRRLRLRTVIGKTTMGRDTARALQDVGGVHLTKIGLCGNHLAQQVRSIEGVHFLDELGKTEATWVLEVEKLGPFFVDIDAAGNNYFERLDSAVRGKLPSVYASLGIPVDFSYTDVNAAGSDSEEAAWRNR